MQGIELFEKSLLSKSTVPYTLPRFTASGDAVFSITNENIGLGQIIRLISGIAHFVHGNHENKKVLIQIEKANFDEKLLYILLECYLEHLISEHDIPVRIEYNEKTSIITKGLLSMPMQLLKDGTYEHRKKFLAKFQNEIYKGHYRKVYEPPYDGNLEYLSQAMTDICIFLVNKGVDDGIATEIAEVVVELVGNANEHTNEKCLVDIDVADKYLKKHGDPTQEYYGVNICVLNFSHILLGTQIQNKMCFNPILMIDPEKAPRYEQLKKAYLNHKKFFSEDYTEDDFFMLSAFQNKISGRVNDTLNGGTGLPQVIKSLESKSDNHACYVISGKRMMALRRDLLQYNDEMWLGMNKENDFIGHRPEAGVFGESQIFFPGTAFNLNFILFGRKHDGTSY